jgi:2-phospho-L-lactate guanylyltransferase
VPDRRVADLSNLHVVVPVRAVRDGKRRLSPVLDDATRSALVAGLLEHTLDVLATWGAPAVVHVVSPDPTVMPIARARGARPLLQPDTGLNEGVQAARAVAAEAGATALLVLPSDLPDLDPGSLDLLLDAADAASAAGGGRPVVAVAPADARSGTNALLCAPPDAIEPGFGPGSFERHLARAEAAEAAVQVVIDTALGFDLDTPEDLALLGSERLAGLLAAGAADRAPSPP